MPLSQISRELATTMQEFTQQGYDDGGATTISVIDPLICAAVSVFAAACGHSVSLCLQLGSMTPGRTFIRLILPDRIGRGRPLR